MDNMTPRESSTHGELPPGQRRVAGFPRFGAHLHHPPPPIPPNPTIEVTGAIGAPFTVALTDLDGLPRAERAADFHCVAGWSATGLRWEGVSFASFYRTLIESRLAPDVTVTDVVFRGLDGYSSIACLDDALAEDVLIATRLDEQPLSPAHGAPVRLVSPSQYGYISTKHLCTIELHSSKPRDDHPYSVLTRSHPRARVWMEERHPWFPAAAIRPVYRALIRPIAWLSARGAR
jgi:DMSO/TMAO reductase YedYZ molybdopterin-dependent catalytic subunit